MPIKVQVLLDIWTIRTLNRLLVNPKTEQERDAISVFRRQSTKAVTELKTKDEDGTGD